MPADATLIRVHSQWDDWRNADVRLEDLHDVHWLQPARAPHALAHGYISCHDIVTGQIPHDCDRQSDHRLLVCILKRHTIPVVYEKLARDADQRQSARPDPYAVARVHTLQPGTAMTGIES